MPFNPCSNIFYEEYTIDSDDDQSCSSPWEKVLINESVISLPPELGSIDNIKNILNENTWNHVLDDSDRALLIPYLPTGCGTTTEQIKGTLRILFSSTEKLGFDMDIQKLANNINMGCYTPSSKRKMAATMKRNAFRNKRYKDQFILNCMKKCEKIYDSLVLASSTVNKPKQHHDTKASTSSSLLDEIYDSGSDIEISSPDKNDCLANSFGNDRIALSRPAVLRHEDPSHSLFLQILLYLKHLHSNDKNTGSYFSDIYTHLERNHNGILTNLPTALVSYPPRPHAKDNSINSSNSIIINNSIGLKRKKFQIPLGRYIMGALFYLSEPPNVLASNGKRKYYMQRDVKLIPFVMFHEASEKWMWNPDSDLYSDDDVLILEECFFAPRYCEWRYENKMRKKYVVPAREYCLEGVKLHQSLTNIKRSSPTSRKKVKNNTNNNAITTSINLKLSTSTPTVVKHTLLPPNDTTQIPVEELTLTTLPQINAVDSDVSIHENFTNPSTGFSQP